MRRSLLSAIRSAVVDLEGVILSPNPVVQQLKKFADDDSIKAIILHVNSPGGGVAASEEIYREVKRIRDDKKKRIVASIETVGASGAYYVSSATNKIYADNGSIVGFDRRYRQWVNYGELLQVGKTQRHHDESRRIQGHRLACPRHDSGRAEYLQGMIDNMHSQFIQAVADGRKVKVEDIKSIANGKVWTGQQALPMKLVDQLADFQTAVEDTAKSVNIKGEPVLVRPEKERKTLARPDVWGRFRVDSHPGEADGSAHRVLLHVEVMTRIGFSLQTRSRLRGNNPP